MQPFVGLTLSSCSYTSVFLELAMLEPRPLSCVSARKRVSSVLVFQYQPFIRLNYLLGPWQCILVHTHDCPLLESLSHQSLELVAERGLWPQLSSLLLENHPYIMHCRYYCNVANSIINHSLQISYGEISALRALVLLAFGDLGCCRGQVQVFAT